METRSGSQALNHKKIRGDQGIQRAQLYVSDLRTSVNTAVDELAKQLIATKDVGERSSELLHRVNRSKT